jgi:putative flippase GtrA
LSETTVHRNLPWQVILYLIFGITQFGIDCSLFAILVHFQVDLKFANVLTRFCAALVGFVLNGLFTFQNRNKTNIRLLALIRYVTLWVALTVTSTLLLMASRHFFGQNLLSITKVFVEAFLACVSFLVMKLWVYGHADDHSHSG